ncbi:unnamed protein product [Arctia plantaginis]|uniref:Uncharacterized protein n=1 Tax=Arctia plantaginis TaxID=874455 RepID=A0A8S1B4L9_ARCPL|nr:unnamed protein product [Arctia plantaginis]CAB3256644.1 unnamed protein product [Arctia plantaginis]
MIYLYVVVCNILFLPVILCNDITVTKSKVINNTPPVSLLPNETQVPSEGGSISPDKLAIALPKNNDNIPSLDKETGKSKIVARKGAGNYTDEITNSSEKPILSLSENVSLKANTSIANSNTTNEQSTTTIKNITLQMDNSSVVNKSTVNNSSENANNTVQLPKKPLILNADLLENAQSEIKSSPATIVNSQIQSPNNKVKTYISSANNHPGMVMPIVITILLVPMFAVLGYMALRRGQEAWKNRHYKRMDFLLDGMYND